MMATTHALWGLAVGAVAAVVAPGHAPVVLTAGFLGGAFPDLDLYAGHRKSLHFPVYYPLVGLVVTGLAVLTAHPFVVAAAVFLVAAAVHSTMDILGGGLELRPWEATSNRAVFDHWRGVWVAPRRWVPYDGAPEDLVLAVAVAVPLLFALDGLWPSVVTAVLALSTGYALLRKPMVWAAERLVGWLPLRVLRYVPERFLVGFDYASDPGPAR